MDPTPMSLQTKTAMVLVLFSSEVSFHDHLLFCAMSGGMFNTSPVYLVKHCLQMESVFSFFAEIAACCWAFRRISFSDAELW